MMVMRAGEHAHRLCSSLVGSERSRQVALENIEIVQRYFRERIGWNGEILRQDIRWGVRNKIGHQERIELGCLAVIEGDDKFAAVGTEALQRMRKARREEPQVTFVHIGVIGLPDRVEDGDAA